MQGVAVGIFVKHRRAKTEDKAPARVFHRHVWGDREAKYDWLMQKDLIGKTVGWSELNPHSPFYLYTPQDEDLTNEFERGLHTTRLFPINVLGFQTHRDNVAIADDETTLKEQVQTYLTTAVNDSNWKRFAHPISFRPFDIRYGYLDRNVIDRPRPELLQHVVNRENITLLLIRQMQDNMPYTHVLVSKHASIDRMFACSRGAATVFPLYLYPSADQLFNSNADWPRTNGRRPNLSKAFVAQMAGKLGLSFVSDGRGDLHHSFGPEDVFHYAYAIFLPQSHLSHALRRAAQN